MVSRLMAVALQQFYIANPDFQVPSLKQTAKYAGNIQKNAADAQDAIIAAEMAAKDALDERNLAKQVLPSGMRSLLSNLKNSLKTSPGETRWLAFGFDTLVTPSTPGKPTNVTAQLSANGEVLVS